MDGSHFDALTRSLRTARSRRHALAGLLGIALGLLGPRTEEVAAKKRQPRRRTIGTEACIPTGKRCPSKKPRGQRGKTLGCNQCCQRRTTTNLNGKTICYCAETGTTCTQTRECCDGVCSGGVCTSSRTAPLSPPSPPPPPLPPLVFNRFGCVDVGQACRGDDSVCCSGRCAGVAPSPGQPDTSQCVAHDVGTCPPGTPTCPLVTSCTTDTGFVGTCLPTTGAAAYCASAQTCAICTKDSDCIPIAGATAACVAACDTRCPDTGGRLCAGNLVD